MGGGIGGLGFNPAPHLQGRVQRKKPIPYPGKGGNRAGGRNGLTPPYLGGVAGLQY